MLRHWVIALVLGVAACTTPQQDNGIASADGGTAVTGTRPADVYEPEKWIKCLREQGLTVDDPNPSDPGGGKPYVHEELVTKDKVEAATKACQRYNTRFGEPNPPPDPAQVEQERKFAQCMREHGIDWDDPDPNYQTPAEVPSDDPRAGKPTPSGPQFDKAIEECSKRVPGIIATVPGGKK